MSTRIYNAYLYSKSISSLMAHIVKYREKWFDHQADRIYDLLKRIQLRPDDELHKTLFKPDGVNLRAVHDLIKSQSAKDFKTWTDEFDVSGSIAVYFYRNMIIVQSFLNDNKAPPFVNRNMRDFHYQDSCDPDHDLMLSEGKITKERHAALVKDWKLRKKVWDTIFDKTHSPAQAGLTYEFVGMMDVYVVVDRLRVLINTIPGMDIAKS
jgi:hypothetical protein